MERSKNMQWYVLCSKPNKEEPLWREVVARGLEVFYPSVEVKPVDPRSRTRRPYFPGYMFVQTRLVDVGQSVFAWLPFARGLVSFGGEPAVVPDDLVAMIRRRVDEINAAGGEQMVGLIRGEKVLIRGGPFDNYEAIFDAHVAGSERVRVLLRLLEHRQVRLDLPSQQIEQIKRR
jgi:transcriptional antiterminator RfaH